MTVPPLDVVLPDGESSEVPELPETITEVDTAQEAVKSFDDLWNNLRYQHREKFKEYSELQASLSAMNFDQGETRVDFTKMNDCLLYTSPSPRDVEESRMPSSA